MFNNIQLKKPNLIFLILIIFTLSISCNKNEETLPLYFCYKGKIIGKENCSISHLNPADSLSSNIVAIVEIVNSTELKGITTTSIPSELMNLGETIYFNFNIEATPSPIITNCDITTISSYPPVHIYNISKNDCLDPDSNY